jgi:transcriptional regulator with XRE-family HTH domain
MAEKSSSWPADGDLAAALGARVRGCRRQLGLSQRQLAARLRISRSMIPKYERGVHLPPTGVLVRLAAILGVSTDTLVGHAPQDPRLVRFVDAIEDLDEESRQAVVQALEGVVRAYGVILERRRLREGTR